MKQIRNDYSYISIKIIPLATFSRKVLKMEKIKNIPKKIICGQIMRKNHLKNLNFAKMSKTLK